MKRLVIILILVSIAGLVVGQDVDVNIGPRLEDGEDLEGVNVGPEEEGGGAREGFSRLTYCRDLDGVDPLTASCILIFTSDECSEDDDLRHPIPDRCSFFIHECENELGDVNNDKSIDISDIVYIFNFIFGNGEGEICKDSADLNNDDVVDISDGIYLANYLFLSGNEPISTRIIEQTCLQNGEESLEDCSDACCPYPNSENIDCKTACKDACTSEILGYYEADTHEFRPVHDDDCSQIKGRCSIVDNGCNYRGLSYTSARCECFLGDRLTAVRTI